MASGQSPPKRVAFQGTTRVAPSSPTGSNWFRTQREQEDLRAQEERRRKEEEAKQQANDDIQKVGTLLSKSRGLAGGYVPVPTTAPDGEGPGSPPLSPTAHQGQPSSSMHGPTQSSQPFILRTTTDVHPDTLLRQTGLIIQRGKVKSEKNARVTYDWRRSAWYRDDMRDKEAGRVKLPLDSVPDGSKEGRKARRKKGLFKHPVTDRVDTVHQGVIRVVGYVDFHRLLTREQDRQKRQKNQSLTRDCDNPSTVRAFLEHKKRRRASARDPEPSSAAPAAAVLVEADTSDSDADDGTQSACAVSSKQSQVRQAKRLADMQRQGFGDQLDAFGAFGIDDQPQNIVDAEDEGNLLSAGDVLRFVRQYLQRSIPKAARDVDAVIFSPIGGGDLAAALGKGVSSLESDATHKLPVVGVHPWNERLDPECCDQAGADYAALSELDLLTMSDEDKLKITDDVFRKSTLIPSFTHHILVSLPEQQDPPDERGRRSRELEMLSNGGKEVRNVTNKDLLDVALNLVTELARGFNTGDKGRNKKLTTDNGKDKKKTDTGEEHLPPLRRPAQVVTVLFGGHRDTTKFDLIHCVRNKWLILVVEGTGGYADVIAEKIRTIEELAEGIPTDDDYKRALSDVDALTAQIICDGELRLVTKGTLPETFARDLSAAITGDKTLTHAWKKYAMWNKLGEGHELSYRQFMQAILILGMIATAFAITQTYLQLQYPDYTRAPANGTATWWWFDQGEPVSILYGMLNILVIILPIAIQLLQSIANKFNAGAKWVSLRSAAEKILVEIYQYRTQTRKYSRHAVNEAKERKLRAQHREGEAEAQAASVAAAAQGETEDAEAAGTAEGAAQGAEHSEPTHLEYSSRSELLHLRLQKFTQELIDSEVAAESIPEWLGPVPPPHIKAHGDDGFSDLSPQEYVDLRLVPKIRAYHREAGKLDKQKKLINGLIYAIGALGTALAALATYDSLKALNLGAWVALTTSVGNALTRYLDYTKTEWLHRKYTSTMHELQRFESWWLSRGNDGDNCMTRDELMAGCEGKVVQEVEEFKQQLHIAVQEAKKEAQVQQAERDSIKSQMESGEQPAMVKKLEEIGLQNINVDSIEAAFKDPDGPAGQKLKQVMQRLDAEFGGVIEKAKKAAESTAVGAEFIKHINKVSDIAQGCLDAAGNIVNGAKMAVGPLDVAKLIPKDIQDFAKDHSRRKHLLIELDPRKGGSFDPRQMTYTTFLQITEKMKRSTTRQVVTQFQSLPLRMGVESLYNLSRTELQQEFDRSLDKLGLRASDLIDSRDGEEDLMSEMKKVASLPWQSMSYKDILTSVSNNEVRKSLRRIGESKMRGVIKRAEVTLVQSNPALELLRWGQQNVASMDLDAILTEEGRAATLEQLDSCVLPNGDPIPDVLMDKDEILSLFPADLPAEVSQNLERMPHSTLVSYVEGLRKGSLAARMLDNWLSSPDQMMMDTCENIEQGAQKLRAGAGRVLPLGKDMLLNAGLKKLEVVLHSQAGREKFVMAAKRFNQVEINTLAKAAILKKIQNIPGIDVRMAEFLKLFDVQEMGGLRKVMSGLRATFGNSYTGRIFDLLTDELSSFDANIILSDIEDREKLVERMQDFKSETPDGACKVRRLSKQQILGLLGYKQLVAKCTQLDVDQLRELIERLRMLMNNSFHKRVFDKALDELGRSAPGRHRMTCYRDAGIHTWGEEVVDAFVSHMLAADDRVLGTVPTEEAKWREELLGSDPQLMRLTSALDVNELQMFCLRLKDFAGDRVIANIFETCLSDLSHYKSLQARFDAAFQLTPIRHRMVMCMTNLIVDRRANKERALAMADILDADDREILDLLRGDVILPARRFCHDAETHGSDCFVCNVPPSQDGKAPRHCCAGENTPGPGFARDSSTALWRCEECIKRRHYYKIPDKVVCPCREQADLRSAIAKFVPGDQSNPGQSQEEFEDIPREETVGIASPASRTSRPTSPGRAPAKFCPYLKRDGHGVLRWSCYTDENWQGPAVEEPDAGTFGSCKKYELCGKCRRQKKGSSPACGKLIDVGVIVNNSLRSNIERQSRKPEQKSNEAQEDSSPNDALLETMTRVFGSERRFVKVVQLLLGEFMVTASYRMFLQLSMEISSFNLREVVVSMRSRQCLCPLLLRLVWNKRLCFSPDPPHQLKAVIVAPHSDEGLRYGGQNQDPEVVAVQPYPQSSQEYDRKGKEAIIRLCDEFDDAGMEVVTNDLQNLTLPQLRQLLSSFYHYVRSSYIGVFFQCVERSIVMSANKYGASFGRDGGHERMVQKTIEAEAGRRARDEAIALIKNTWKRQSKLVKSKLDNFDARVFSNRAVPDKKRRFEDLEVRNEQVSSLLAKSDEKATRTFFANLINVPEHLLSGEDRSVDFDEEQFIPKSDVEPPPPPPVEHRGTPVKRSLQEAEGKVQPGASAAAGAEQHGPQEVVAQGNARQAVIKCRRKGSLAEALGCGLSGCTIASVVPGGEAQKHGVQVGWVITQIGDVQIGIGEASGQVKKEMEEAWTGKVGRNEGDDILKIVIEDEDEVPLLNTVTLRSSHNLMQHWADEDAPRRDGIPISMELFRKLKKLVAGAKTRSRAASGSQAEAETEELLPGAAPAAASDAEEAGK